MYEAIKASQKPVTISMSNVAASGGFYLAMAGKKIFANPGTITGSIGVIMEFANLEKLYEWAKVKRYSIKTGEFKDAGAEYREMRPEERKLFQGMVDNVLSQFKKAIVEGRKKKPEEIDAIADGRVFSGEQAHQLGLVDELGTFEQAVIAAAKEAGMKGHEMYKPERKRKWIEQLLEGLDQDPNAEESHSQVSEILASSFRKTLGLSTSTPLKPGLYWLWKGL
jgi:protease-4